MKNKVLIIEDDDLLKNIIKDRLQSENKYECYLAVTGTEGIKSALENGIDLVILDYELPDMNGDEVIKSLKKNDPLIEVIVISAYGSIDRAVQMMKYGAADFLTKPVNFERLTIIIHNIVEKQNLNKNLTLLKDIGRVDRFIGTKSQKTQLMAREIFQASETDTTILIQGESGTGKGIVARLIHDLGKRKNNPYVKVDCAVMHDTLIQSDLFGHEKGAFTGASFLKRGRLELANRGTVFFDEIGDLKESMQGPFLRIIQDKEFERVGGIRPIKPNIRILTATNKKLLEMVKNGTFREDLYFRLNVVVIEVPPLRKRLEDIDELTDYFFESLGRELNKPIIEIPKSIKERFSDYKWPGNVRELKNTIERLLVFSENGKVKEESLPKTIREIEMVPSFDSSEAISLKDAVNKFKKNYILRVIDVNNGNIALAAKELGIQRTYLYSLMEQLQIGRER